MTSDHFVDGNWTSEDGLTLHFRDYAARDDVSDKRPPILCLHGLTRNVRDFAGFAERFSGEWRVIVPEMRGRGDSNYATGSESYNVGQYVRDVQALLDQEKIDRYVAIGTSMGGLMTLVQAAQDASRLAGVVLNDIGPAIEAAGLDKIREYVGQGRNFPTWIHAARALADTHGEAHPGYATQDWIAMAKRVMVLGPNGRISFDYDMKIAEPILQSDDAAAPADLWPALDAMKDRPVLMVRGALSNLLSQATFDEMKRRLPDAETVTVADTGHAPTLDEPEAVEAIERLLDRVAAESRR
ncbi:alpha/beta fold hydrolase [Altererythrobacter aurantiacus]|uniref:Alpha/beta fold hydrolase n=1 Tax=Parapontixanthobacter aurantiacus TaxID=1463599 RepID=A0A844ZD86_9SPHN|nr:alpha/beta hydrolase [Parapontixanthobacter aurantiacus]MXO84890.1 alpha/beta fold hydrolase [Parapontixanthobacter aurantiacus]